MSRRRIPGSIGVAVTVALLALAGCSSADDGQPSDEHTDAQNQEQAGARVDADATAAYGCALVTEADHQGGAVESWDLGVGGDVGTHLLATSAAADLLGGSAQADLPGYADLAPAAAQIHEGVSRIAVDQLQSGVSDLVAACQEHQFSSDEPDTSTEGRIGFACTLAGTVQGSGIPAQEWPIVSATVGESTTDGSTPGASTAEADAALVGNQAAGIAALLGVPLGWQVPGEEDLSEATQGMWAAVAQLDFDRVGDDLDEIVQICNKF